MDDDDEQAHFTNTELALPTDIGAGASAAATDDAMGDDLYV